jgi:hypothetical protein
MPGTRPGMTSLIMFARRRAAINVGQLTRRKHRNMQSAQGNADAD